ncbi:MAG: sterol carrier family protein, partial [Mycobacterium sp.]
RHRIDPARTRAAVLALAGWLRDDARPAPDRAELAVAVQLTARTLAEQAPGAGVEVRIPPFVAVQCVSGPRHTRGTPSNVVETDPRTWLLLATGLLQLADAKAAGTLHLSGSRAGEIQAFLPLVSLAGRASGHCGSRDS